MAGTNLFDFTWYKCRAGYRLVRATDPEFARQAVDPSECREMIRPNAHERIAYQPDLNRTCEEFVEIRSPEHLLNFVQKHGLLFDLNGDPIESCLEAANLFRGLLSRKRQGARKLAHFFDSYMQSKMRAARDNHGFIRVSSSTLAVPPMWGLDVVSNPVTGLRFQLRAGTLFLALWAPLVHKVNVNVRIRRCRQCNLPLRVGTEGEMHGNSKFCSDEHQSAFYRQKRSVKAGPKKCLYCNEGFETGPGTGKRTDAKFCCENHRIHFNSVRRGKG